jgi:glycosyltransferase involved in cell wall biosynthesis
LDDGSLIELGRKPRRGVRFQPGVFLLRAAEIALRRSGVMFSEPVWWVRVEPGHFDVVHQHLFAVRQSGPRTPVVSSAGYPLTDHYRAHREWSRARVAIAGQLERVYAEIADVHVPWLRQHRGVARMTVYSERFRQWLIDRGQRPDTVSVIGTFLESSPLSGAQRTGRALAFVGRAFEAKGGPVALGAFDRLRRHDPRWTMTVVTDPLNVARVTPRPGLRVVGGASRDDVLEILGSTDVLLAPTVSDCGVPYGQLEAMRAGAAVVTSTWPWLDDRLKGPGVRRVDAEPGAVAAAVLDLGKDLPAAQRGARELFDRFFAAPACHEGGLAAAYRSAAGR